jgi:predicted nucleic acid-binding protein
MCSTFSRNLDLQQELWEGGLICAVGAFDCWIAAYAVVNEAVLLNSDRDFGCLSRVTGGVVQQEYVAE